MTDLVEMPIEEQEEESDSKIDLHDPQLYINRELSLLEFHRRVLGGSSG